MALSLNDNDFYAVSYYTGGNASIETYFLKFISKKGNVYTFGQCDANSKDFSMIRLTVPPPHEAKNPSRKAGDIMLDKDGNPKVGKINLPTTRANEIWKSTGCTGKLGKARQAARKRSESKGGMRKSRRKKRRKRRRKQKTRRRRKRTVGKRKKRKRRTD